MSVANQRWQCPLCHSTTRGKRHGDYLCCRGCHTELCVDRAGIEDPSALPEVVELLRGVAFDRCEDEEGYFCTEGDDLSVDCNPCRSRALLAKLGVKP